MLEPNGRQILKILGRTQDADLRKGILEPVDMPAALAALESAMAADELHRQEAQAKALEDGVAAPPSDGISLRHRATPLIAMIQRCLQEDKAIVWGV